MSYADLLKYYIKESGMTLEEISKECEAMNVSVHPTYISKLRLGQRPAPSDHITRAISRVIGGDEEKLILASFAERFPGEHLYVVSLNEFYKRTFESFYILEEAAKTNSLAKIKDLDVHIKNLESSSETKISKKDFINNPIEILSNILEKINKIRHYNHTIGVVSGEIIDFADDSVLKMPLYFDGVEMNSDEKKEFVAIVRGIFSARKALKGNP